MDSIDSISSSRGSQILTGRGYMNTILERKLIEKSSYNSSKRSLNFHRADIRTRKSVQQSFHTDREK